MPLSETSSGLCTLRIVFNLSSQLHKRYKNSWASTYGSTAHLLYFWETELAGPEEAFLLLSGIFFELGLSGSLMILST